MRSWARKHFAVAIFLFSLAVALLISGLSDINERFPFGHEAGIFVSQLAFAYAGAYIFNWLIVERPRAEALRGYYSAAAHDLVRLAAHPAVTVSQMSALADPTRSRYSAPVDELSSLLDAVDWEDDGRLRVASWISKNLQRDFRATYQSLVPILNNFEPEVAVAIADLAASPLHDGLKILETTPALMVDPGYRDLFVRNLYNYEQHGKLLATKFRKSSFTPQVDQMLDRDKIQYAGVDLPQRG